MNELIFTMKNKLMIQIQKVNELCTFLNSNKKTRMTTSLSSEVAQKNMFKNIKNLSNLKSNCHNQEY